MQTRGRFIPWMVLASSVAIATPVAWSLVRSASHPTRTPARLEGSRARLAGAAAQLRQSRPMERINRMEDAVAEVQRDVLGVWHDAWLARDAARFDGLFQPGATQPSWSSAAMDDVRTRDGIVESAWRLDQVTTAVANESSRYLSSFRQVEHVQLDVIRADGDRSPLSLSVRIDVRGVGADGGRRHSRGLLQVAVAREGGQWRIRGVTAPAALESLRTTPDRAPGFEDITRTVGLDAVPVIDRREAIRRGGYAIASADYDGDRRADLLVGSWGPLQLFRNTPTGYRDVTAEAGLANQTLVKSAAFADLDNDGRRDLLLLRFVEHNAQGGVDPQRGAEGEGDLVVFRNLGDGRFERRSSVLTSHRHFDRAMPLAVADFDGNGTLDVYIGFPGTRDFTNDLARTGGRPGLEHQGLWLNDGHWGLRESEHAVQSARGDQVFPHAALATDLDSDGRTDIVVVDDSGHINPVYRNLGGGRFEDSTRAMGLDARGWGMGASAGDFDGDGRTDLVMTNITFTSAERIAAAWRGQDLSRLPPEVRAELTTMGARGAFLFHNKGDGTFEDVTDRAGLSSVGAAPGGAEWIDYNNDGHLDLYVANGLWSGGPQDAESFFVRVMDNRAARSLGEGNSPQIGDLLMSLPTGSTHVLNPVLTVLREFRGTLSNPSGPQTSERPSLSFGGFQRNRLFRNNADGTFTEVGYFENVDRLEDGYMTSTADVDGDGQQDLVLRNADPPPGYTAMPVVALRRRPTAARAITLSLTGNRDNRDGIGAVVTAMVGGRRVVREVRSVGGACQGEPVAYIGLGAEARADALTVRWPSGLTERFQNVQAGRVSLTQGSGARVVD